jgi:hypothetical protein
MELNGGHHPLMITKLGIPQDVAGHAIGNHNRAHKEHCAIGSGHAIVEGHYSGWHVSYDGDEIVQLAIHQDCPGELRKIFSGHSSLDNPAEPTIRAGAFGEV